MRFYDMITAADARGYEFAEWVENNITYLPEIYMLEQYNQNPEHHPEGYTVLDHILKAICDYKGKDPIVNVSLLFHDIGKGITACPSENGPYFRFYGHDKEGHTYFNNDIVNKYEIPEKEAYIIGYVIRNHMRFHRACEMRTAKCKAIASDPNFDILAKVCYHDDHCRGEKNFRKAEFIESYKRFKKVLL